MSYEDFSKLKGTHAAFSPSQPYWLNYDDEKVVQVFMNKKAAELGTRLHKWAEDTIKLGLKQPRSKKTIYAYVNDAIGYRMETEKLLYYSPYFYGTADALVFKNNFLRIHDLKTGKGSVHMEQLEIYAALFCLQEKIKPTSIKMELRIYQNDGVIVHEPTAEDIQRIMEIIVHIDSLVETLE